MPRLLVSLPFAVLTTGVLAQCPQGTTAGLVKWQATSGYASTLALDDESITSPPVVLTPPFFMPGAVGTLDRMWVHSNGEIYFTDSTLALTQPVNGALYGISSLAEMRGVPAGASARIAVLGGDHQGSVAAGAQWSVTIDSSAAGLTTITWTDIARYLNTTDRFSFQAVLAHASGVVTMNYGTTFPPSLINRWVGISIGNNVGSTTTPSSDFSGAPTSGSLGLLFQSFGSSATAWDLAGNSLTISPNGSGGYVASPLVPYVPPTCAANTSYGVGCYSITGNNTLHETFATTVAAKIALDTNSMTFVRVGTGYSVVWNGAAGPAFVAPSGSAAALVFADNDDGNVAFTPSAPIPVPGGTAATWNCSVNGILTAAAAANNAGDFTPAAVDVENNTTAPNIGFYSWHDHLITAVPPAVSGSITTEEVGGILYVTWNAVECYDFGGSLATINPGTWQYQVELSTGNVTIVWATMDPSLVSNLPTVVGATLNGAGNLPGAVGLATGLPITLSADIAPLSLTASGRPVITLGGAGASQPVTFTLSAIVAAMPPLPTGISWLVFSFGQDLPGTDLAPGMPGCKAHLTSLDAIFPYSGALGADSIVVSFPQPLSPGMTVHAQALSLFPPGSLPGGLNLFGGVTSNGITSTFELQ